MTKQEQAYMAMFLGLEKELNDSSDIYANDPDLKAEVDAFKVDKAKNEQASNAAHIINTGFSAEKLAAKMVVAEEAAIISGKAFVKFSNLNKIIIAKKLLITTTDYSHVSDIECAKRAQNAHDLLLVNIDDLKAGTITEERLIEFQKNIELFKNLKGTAVQVQEVSPELTKAFKQSFAPVKRRVKQIKLLVADYVVKEPDFYKRMMACTKLPVIHVLHTKVMINAVAKSTGSPVAELQLSLIKAKKTWITDKDGIGEIEGVKNGKDVLTAKLKDEIVLTLDVWIKQSTTNLYKLVIESL